MGAVTRLVDIEERDDKPRPRVVATHAACGLDVLGVRLRLPKHDHQSKSLDVEAHRDHVCRDGAVHTLRPIMEANPEAPARLGHHIRRHARGELHHLREGLAVLEESAVFAHALADAIGLDGVLHLFLEDPAGPTQFAQAVEVPEHGHVGVGRVLEVLVPARVAVGALGSAHEREPRLPHHDLRIPSLGSNPEVQSRRDLRGRHRVGKERVPTIGARRRKHLREWPREQRLNLVLRPSHGGGRRHDLRPHRAAVDLAHAERLDCRLIEAGHRAEWTRDQVQLVLDDEVGRGQRCGEARAPPRLRGSIEPLRIGPLRPAEQCPRLPDPRQRGKLVHRRDHERR